MLSYTTKSNIHLSQMHIAQYNKHITCPLKYKWARVNPAVFLQTVYDPLILDPFYKMLLLVGLTRTTFCLYHYNFFTCLSMSANLRCIFIKTIIKLMVFFQRN